MKRRITDEFLPFSLQLAAATVTDKEKNTFLSIEDSNEKQEIISHTIENDILQQKVALGSNTRQRRRCMQFIGKVINIVHSNQ